MKKLYVNIYEDGVYKETIEKYEDDFEDLNDRMRRSDFYYESFETMEKAHEEV